MNNMSTNLYVISPALALTVTGLLIVALGLIFPKVKSPVHFGLALLGLTVSAVLTFSLLGENQLAFGGMIVLDSFALTFNFIFLIGAAMSVLLAANPHEDSYLLHPEFLSIILFATVGMVLMAGGKSLLTIFLGLETLSVSLYILAGFKRTEAKSLEAAFKYFLLGAFASGFLLYGIAFIYGAAGSVDLAKIADFVANNSMAESPLMILGGLLIFVGLGFKVAIVPFHMWAPDVYQGAPTPITAFMSTGSKAAAFAAMLRVLFAATDGAVGDWITLFWILCVLTMFVGNLAALLQSNIKRMLAYSSIAHAGYILVGVVAWNDLGASSVIFYLLSYTFMNVGAFGVLALISTKDQEYLEIDDLKGLAFRRPIVAAVMAVFMFSLAGLPPTAGFVGKFYLFSAAVKAGHTPLVILGVVSSMISLYYYLGVVVVMFMKEPQRAWPEQVKMPAVFVSLGLAVVGTVGLGILPSRFMDSFRLLVNQIL